MAIQTTKKTKQKLTLATIAKEVREIKAQMEKLLLLIPQESLDEYQNGAAIKRSYANALKRFPA